MAPKIQRNYCPECYQSLKNNTHWCQLCQARHFEENADNWTTGHKTLDTFLLETQKNAKECTEYLEYIDFDGIIGISKYDIAELGEVYTGNWKRGPVDSWDENEERFVCRRELIRVALISLTTEPRDFLKELDIHYRARKNNGLMMRVFGVTREQITGKYMMVAETNEWDLRHYVSHHFVRLNWTQKLAILHTLALGLINHHQQNSIDSDDYNMNNSEFANNNNIVKSHLELRVNELGLGDCKDFMPIIGYYRNDLLPLFAPEIILHGKTHTKESEVYTFGLLMWEFVINRPPFYEIPHDSEFVRRLSTGLYPKTPSCAPNCYTQLMLQCWHSNPHLRPSMQDIAQMLSEWRFQTFEKEAFAKVERRRIRDLKSRGQDPFGAMLNPQKTHPQAIYACRHIKLPNFSSINRHRPLFESIPDSSRKSAEATVKDESFFISKSILQFREKFPEVELEPEDEDLSRQYDELSLDFPPEILAN